MAPTGRRAPRGNLARHDVAGDPFEVPRLSLLILTASRFEADELARRMPLPPAPLPVGVGPIAAALGAARALDVDPPFTACLLLGLAGTRDPVRVPVGAVVLANEVLDEAVGAGHGRHALALAELGLPAADRLPQRLPTAVPLPGRVTDPPWTVGAVGTLAAASCDPADAAGWRARHPDVLVEEMEGYAVALACRQADVPLAVLRAVCNVAGDRDHRRWRFDLAFDAAAAAAQVLLSALRPRE